MGTKNRRSGSQFNPKGITQGVTLVCPDTGDPIQCVVDENGKTRLLVDTRLSISIPSESVDLDGRRMKVYADGSIDANVEVDAADGDNIAISGHQTPLFRQGADTITTAAFEEIYTFTSTNNNTMVSQLDCFAETPAVFRVVLDGTEIKRKSSDASDLNVVFNFEEHRPVLATKVLKIEAQVHRFVSSKSPFATFCSLEGYIK
jgi:hypothetical protein